MEKEIIKSIKISVVYDTTRNKGQNDFNTLQELKLWLDKNPHYAEKLGYKKK